MNRDRETETQNPRILLTHKEAARALGVCGVTLRRFRAEGCPAVYVGLKQKGRGIRPRYNLPAVLAWLEARTAQVAAAPADGKEVEA